MASEEPNFSPRPAPGRTTRPGAAGGRTLPRAAGTSSARLLLGVTDVNQPDELVRSAVPVSTIPVSTVPVWFVRAVWPGRHLAMNAPQVSGRP